MPYRQKPSVHYRHLKALRRPRRLRRPAKKGVWYCPKCVDEQKVCPYHFKPGNCPEHPRTKLIYDPELTELLKLKT